MDKLKKNLATIYSKEQAPNPPGSELSNILRSVREVVPSTRDKLVFSLVFASVVLAVIFVTPSESNIGENKSMYIYNYSDSFDPS